MTSLLFSLCEYGHYGKVEFQCGVCLALSTHNVHSFFFKQNLICAFWPFVYT